MVTIIGYRLAKNKDEKEFVALELQVTLKWFNPLKLGTSMLQQCKTYKQLIINNTFSHISC